MQSTKPRGNRPQVMIANRSLQTPQYGLIGTDSRDRLVAANFNTTQTKLMFGAMGSGKSYSQGVFIESFTTQFDGLNVLPQPGCAVVFHYSKSEIYRPELELMREPNTNEFETKLLRERYGVEGKPIAELIRVAPSDLVDTRNLEVPQIPTSPLILHPDEVEVESWLTIMGSGGLNQSLEEQVLLNEMRALRAGLTPGALLERIAKHPYLSQEQRYLLNLRIELAQSFINGRQRLADLIKPGRVIIVDMRDPFLDRNMAFRLMLVILAVTQAARLPDGKNFPKLVAFGEAHQYANDPYLCQCMLEMVRLMRHMSLTILIDSQDPESVDKSIISLASSIYLMKTEDPQAVHTIAARKAPFAKLLPEDVAELRTGQAWVWARDASDSIFMERPQKIQIRPRSTMHGGFTKTAVAT